MTSTIDRAAPSLRVALAGQVMLRGEPGFDDARRVWNGEIDRRPAVIARCSGPGDVAAAIRFAREHGLDISVRGGAHNIGGAAVGEDGLMIHLGGLNAVSVDPAARLARCGGGATLAELDAATQRHALAVPAGTVSHTGVGGLTLGGGMGWLSRRHGLTIDNLVSAQVVTADGEVLRASAEQHPDLFWALRGGGGNFGVVTEFEYRLHPVGPIVQLAMLFWEIGEGEAALRLARDVSDALPRTAGVMIAALNAPAAPFVPAMCQGAPGYALIVAGFGAAAEHAGLVDEIRAALPPLFELVTPMPYTELQQFIDGSAPWGILAYERSVSLDSLSDGAIRAIVEHFPRRRSSMSLLPIYPLGGAVHDVSDEDTAVGGLRDTGVVVGMAGVAPTKELLAHERRWVRELWDALLPYAHGVGSYVNFMNDYHEGDRVRAAYGFDKYERLAQIKRRYDPDNTFRRNPNIEPARGAA